LIFFFNYFHALFVSINIKGPQWQTIELSEPPQYTALIENLKPATKYIFRVIAEGPAGRSIPTQELIIKTEPQRPAGPPINLAVRPISSTEILVTWMPPLIELRHGEIQGYNIGNYVIKYSINLHYIIYISL